MDWGCGEFRGARDKLMYSQKFFGNRFAFLLSPQQMVTIAVIPMCVLYFWCIAVVVEMECSGEKKDGEKKGHRW